MTGGEIAAIIAAFGSVLGGIAAILVAIRKVHVLVNSQRTDLDRRINQLTAALQTLGADVPAREDPSTT